MICTESAPSCIHSPFTILIDKAEKAPWTFHGLQARSFVDKDQRTYLVRTERRYLGIGMGDYSLAGFEGRVGIERKSLEDFHGTLLGWPTDVSDDQARREWDSRRSVHRRQRFKNELAKLAAMECKAVIVEATLGECLNPDTAPDWGKRTPAENSKYLFSTYLAWQQEYAVPWIFADSREMASVTAFRMLEKFWHRASQEDKRKRKERAHVPELFS